MKGLSKLISNPKTLILLFFLFAIAASVQSLLQKEKYNEATGKKYTTYNNYIIFKQSWYHLSTHKDLYQLYPDEYNDLYKYSPGFAVLFAPLAMLPDTIGLSLWNLLNAFILLLAVYYLPKLSDKQKGLILLTSLIELMTSMQNEQSNGLMAGLLILSFGLLEREKYMMAVCCIVLSASIKLFGIVGLALFLFYPGKWKLILYTIFWTAALVLLPLLVVDMSQLKFLYSSWGGLLQNDHSISYGLSVMGWLYKWFGVDINKSIIVGLGILVFCLPLLRSKSYTNYGFRILTLASILIWTVIFNHKAESPTFIIAMAGVSIWFYAAEKNKINTILFIGCFIFTSLSPTDLFPHSIKEQFVIPYVLKAFPCILVWLKIIYDMIRVKEDRFKEIHPGNPVPG